MSTRIIYIAKREKKKDAIVEIFNVDYLFFCLLYLASAMQTGLEKVFSIETCYLASVWFRKKWETKFYKM